MDRTTNLLGALALGLNDRLQSNLKATLARSGESAAALVVIGYAPGLSVETLRQVLDRSHPGTVRLIDRLEKDGLVERRAAQDGRAVALHLTPSGTERRAELMQQRLDTLEAALQTLSRDERSTFGDLLAKVLTTLPDSDIAKRNVCRLCSVSTCTACPIRASAL